VLTCAALSAAAQHHPTGVKQNYARRCRIPIDAITFDYTCMPAGTQPDAAPADGGASVSGMFVEGARWDPDTAQLAESQPKVCVCLC
jgi:dynein heavy chain